MNSESRCPFGQSCPARSCCLHLTIPPPPPPDEPPPCSIVKQQISRIREACSSRGPTGFRDLGRMFCLYDQVDGGCGGCRRASCGEVERVLRNFGVRLTDEQIYCLCRHLDRSEVSEPSQDCHPCHTYQGKVKLDDLFSLLRPCVSKSRADLIELVYRSIDKDGDGCISLGDIEAAYAYEKNRKFLIGERSSQQVMQAFFDSFLYPGAYTHGINKNHRISKQEFIDYYLGYSTFIDQDVFFDYWMRNNWKIRRSFVLDL